jgi:hypothetical protein
MVEAGGEGLREWREAVEDVIVAWMVFHARMIFQLYW